MKRLIAVLTVSVISVSAMGYGVLFEDNFTDGDSAGWVAADSLGLTVVDDSAGLGSGYALQLVAADGTSRNPVTADFTDASFSKLNIPEAQILSFDFRLTEETDGDRILRFGMFGTDWKGHLVRLSTGDATAGALAYDSDGSSTSVMGGTVVSYLEVSDFGGISDTLKHSVVYTLQRGYDPADGVSKVMFATMILDGTKVLKGMSTTQDWSLTKVAFASAPGNDIIIDNVKVDFVAIPEPATLVLLSIGMVGLIRKHK